MAVNISHLGTENRNSRTKDLDLLSTKEILEIMNDEDLNVVSAIKKALPQIESLVNETIKAYEK